MQGLATRRFVRVSTYVKDFSDLPRHHKRKFSKHMKLRFGCMVIGTSSSGCASVPHMHGHADDLRVCKQIVGLQNLCRI